MLCCLKQVCHLLVYCGAYTDLWLQSLQYWLGGNAENLENLLLNAVRAYTPALKGANIEVAEPQLFPDIGIWHPMAPSRPSATYLPLWACSWGSPEVEHNILMHETLGTRCRLYCFHQASQTTATLPMQLAVRPCFMNCSDRFELTCGSCVGIVLQACTRT